MDFSTLIAGRATTGSIQNWINYSRLDPEEILTEAQAWIYAKLRVPEMVQTSSVSILSGASTAAFPARYRAPIQFGIPGWIGRVRLKDVEWFKRHLAWDENATLPTGLPTYWCRSNDLIQLNTLANQAYTGSMTFYGAPEPLSVTNETNWLTEKYPTVLRRACLMIASEFRKDWEGYDRAEARALQGIAEARVEGDEQLNGVELDFGWEANSGDSNY